MKNTIRMTAILVAAAIMFLAVRTHAQSPVGAHSVVLNNGNGQSITIQVPTSGWTGNIPFVIPIPPAGITQSGFTYPGSASGQILTWVLPNTTGPAPNLYAGGLQGSWQPTTIAGLGGVTGSGAVNTIPIWTTSTNIGNSNLTVSAGTLSFAGGPINAASGYQVGGTSATAGTYLRGNGSYFVSSPILSGDVPTLNQNTTGTAANVTGTVAIANGGTGATTQQAAINALTGTQSSGKYLRSNGSNASLSALDGGDLSAGTVTVAKISATGTASSSTYLRGDGSWSTPPGGGGGGLALYDNNNVKLGTILIVYENDVQIFTDSGYIVFVNWQPDTGGNAFSVSQIYWTGSSCTGTPYYNGDSGATQYYRLLVYSGQSKKLYELASPNTYGVSTTVAATLVDIENPNCYASSHSYGFALTADTRAKVGLPSTFAYPLKIQ